MLNLSKNKIKADGIPPEIGLAESLRELDLSNNEIQILPPELGKCSRLQILTLNFNRIFRIDSIVNLPALDYLYLSHNYIPSLPASKEMWSKCNAKVIDLEGNDLETIPMEVLKYSNLHNLNLKGNQISRA